jgi:hypothetical protein
MRGGKVGSLGCSWGNRRGIFGEWSFRGEITDSSDQIAGFEERHSFDCAVLIFWRKKEGISNRGHRVKSTEGTEKRDLG